MINEIEKPKFYLSDKLYPIGTICTWYTSDKSDPDHVQTFLTIDSEICSHLQKATKEMAAAHFEMAKKRQPALILFFDNFVGMIGPPSSLYQQYDEYNCESTVYNQFYEQHLYERTIVDSYWYTLVKPTVYMTNFLKRPVKNFHCENQILAHLIKIQS